jgi:hypothetical protein
MENGSGRKANISRRDGFWKGRRRDKLYDMNMPRSGKHGSAAMNCHYTLEAKPEDIPFRGRRRICIKIDQVTA